MTAPPSRLTTGRLAPDVVVEPLVRGWYAWPLLLAPATTGLVMRGSHLPIMESFIRSPEAHEEACAIPELAGGPFIDLPASAVTDVRSLYDDTRREHAELASLASALHELAHRLDACHGEPLEDLYASLPGVLRGRVELVYDLSHRASYRVIEPLLYAAPELGLDRSQSVLVTRGHGRRRPFALSTPRLAGPGGVEVRAPFRDRAVDALVAARWHAVDVEGLAAELGVAAADLGGLMTDAPPPPPPDAPSLGDVRVRYFGHATLAAETASTSVVIDPFVTFDASGDPSWPCFTGYELPERVDAVVLTHAHLDHVVLEALLQLRPRIERVIVPRAGAGELQDPSLRLLLRAAGFTDVIELAAFETEVVGDAAITALPFLGEHGDLAIASKAAFAVSALGRSFVAVVDSRNVDGTLYDSIARHVENVDAVFLGMECVGAPLTWLYGPLFHDAVDRGISESRRLAGSDADRAVDLVRRLGARRAYVYAMGLEPWIWHLTTVTEDPTARQVLEADAFVAQRQADGAEAHRLRGAATIML